MAEQIIYGFPAPLPPDVDFYTLTNEDIGFTTALTTGVNDVYSFALPYPSSIDLFEETIVIHAIEFLFVANDSARAVGDLNGLLAFLSMLDKEFPPTFNGNLGDTSDEAWKAQFGGPIYFGERERMNTTVASVEANTYRNDYIRNANYFPPVPLDLLTPLYIQFVNQNTAIDLATSVGTLASFTTGDVERVTLRPWFTKRNLTTSERSARNTAVRFQLLDS